MRRFLFGLPVVMASTCAVLAAGGAPASGVVGHIYANDNRPRRTKGE